MYIVLNVFTATITAVYMEVHTYTQHVPVILAADSLDLVKLLVQVAQPRHRALRDEEYSGLRVSLLQENLHDRDNQAEMDEKKRGEFYLRRALIYLLGNRNCKTTRLLMKRVCVRGKIMDEAIKW